MERASEVCEDEMTRILKQQDYLIDAVSYLMNRVANTDGMSLREMVDNGGKKMFYLIPRGRSIEIDP